MSCSGELTARELEVYDLIIAGLVYHEIAIELGVTRGTARFHVCNILHKLGVESTRKLLALHIKVGPPRAADKKLESLEKLRDEIRKEQAQAVRSPRPQYNPGRKVHLKTSDGTGVICGGRLRSFYGERIETDIESDVTCARCLDVMRDKRVKAGAVWKATS